MLQTCLLVLVSVGVACGSKPKSSDRNEERAKVVASQNAGADDAGPKMGCLDTRDCSACATELREWMVALVEEGHEEMVSSQRGLTHVRLDASESTTRLPVAPIVIVTQDAVTFEGVQVGNPTYLAKETSGTLPELYDRLSYAWEQACSWTKGTKGARELIVQVDASVPWRVVRKVAATADASGADVLVFAFLKPTRVPKPGASHIDKRIEEVDPPYDPKSAVIMQLGPIENSPATMAYGSCKAAAEGLLAAAQQHYKARGDFLVEGLPDAIQSCDCNVEVEAVKSLHWWYSGRRDYKDGDFYAGVRVPLSGGKTRLPMYGADVATWSSAHKALLAQASQGKAFFFAESEDVKVRKRKQPSKAKTACPEDSRNGGFASITGGADFSSGMDDRDVYGGLLGNEIGSSGTTSLLRLGRPTVTGDLDKNVISRHVRTITPRIRNCFEKEILVKPSLQGNLVATFSIDAKGKVHGAKARGVSSSVDSCVATAIGSIQFPKPKSSVVEVSYPISFRIPLAK